MNSHVFAVPAEIGQSVVKRAYLPRYSTDLGMWPGVGKVRQYPTYLWIIEDQNSPYIILIFILNEMNYIDVIASDMKSLLKCYNEANHSNSIHRAI